MDVFTLITLKKKKKRKKKKKKLFFNLKFAQNLLCPTARGFILNFLCTLNRKQYRMTRVLLSAMSI